MRDFLLAKLGHTLIVLFCVLTLVFVVLHLTGDPVMMLLPSNASREEIDALTRSLGRDPPLSVQYGRFRARLARGDCARGEIRHARGARRRLRPHRAGQGAARVLRGAQAHAEERGDADRHRDRAAVRPAAGRRDRLRDDLRVAGGGPSHDLRHLQPRLPAGGGGGVRDGDGVHPGQSPGRPVLRLARSPRQAPALMRPRVPTLLLLAAAPVVAAVICAVLAPQLAPYDPTRGDLSARLRPPAWTAAGSARHLLGTDQLGRDILSRIIFGARVSLLVGVVSSLIGGTIGLTLGMLGGYFRRRADPVVAKPI